MNKKEKYTSIVNYAISMGIPQYQLAFDPNWKKNPKRL